MTDKERFDSLMKLADFRVGIREARRTHEWRVSLGLWVGMAAGLISLRDVPQLVLIIALPLVVFCHAWFWVRWNWVSGERDARLAYYYFDTAQALLLEDSPPPERRPIKRLERMYGYLLHGPPLFQILATAFLAVGLALFAAQPSKRPPTPENPANRADIPKAPARTAP